MGDLVSTTRGARGLLLATLSAALLIACAAAPRADAYIYWTTLNGSTIARANNDGTGVNLSFMTGLATTGHTVNGLAVDGQHIFFGLSDGSAVTATDTIGRANIDGSSPNPNFIPAGSVSSGPQTGGITVNATHIYWTITGASGQIGRANIDGGSPDTTLLTSTTANPKGIALNGTNVFWASVNSNSIGRANLDGTGLVNFFVGAPGVLGVAVDSTQAFWSLSTGSIGHAAFTTPGAPNANFISPGTNTKPDIEIFGSNIYWLTGAAPLAVGRANLDGTGAEPAFIPLTATPSGIAVDGLAPPIIGPPTPPPVPATLKLGKLERRSSNGSAKLSVTVSGAGELSAKGKLLVTQKKTTQAAGTVKLLLKARGRATKALANKGDAKLAVKVTFTPTGDTAITRTRTVKLVRHLSH